MSSGDVFTVSDNLRDGRSTGIQWRVTDRGGTVLRRGICRNALGAGTIAFCDKNLPEGVRLELRFGRCDGTRYSCKTLTGWTDWSAWKSGNT